ncbi:MAG: M20 family metallopeptidase [Planctomycetota bacterium]
MTTATTTTNPAAPNLDGGRLRALIQEELPGLIDLRRALHRCPELGFTEHKTSARIASELDALGLRRRAHMAAQVEGEQGTGVIAHLPAIGAHVDAARGSVGLRADFDALPIAENTGVEYASEHPGLMHACGHDGHTAILLGAARVLRRLDQRPNPVTFVFQPAEEGGAGGAKMCRDGALEGDTHPANAGLGPRVERMYGLHGWPELPLGAIATRPGPLLAATDEFRITIEGTQGHAAYPHLALDPIVASAHVITALQTLPSRSVSPLDSLIVTVGSIHAGSANNVIPAKAELHGTVRTLRDETRVLAKDLLFRTVEQTCAALGMVAQIEWNEGYPVTRNDEREAERVLEITRGAFGEARSLLAPEPGMGGEDFSYYGQRVPACFFLLGLCPPDESPRDQPLLHQAEFDFNDDAIAPGVEMMVRMALS